MTATVILALVPIALLISLGMLLRRHYGGPATAVLALDDGSGAVQLYHIVDARIVLPLTRGALLDVAAPAILVARSTAVGMTVLATHCQERCALPHNYSEESIL